MAEVNFDELRTPASVMLHFAMDKKGSKFNFISGGNQLEYLQKRIELSEAEEELKNVSNKSYDEWKDFFIRDVNRKINDISHKVKHYTKMLAKCDVFSSKIRKVEVSDEFSEIKSESIKYLSGVRMETTFNINECNAKLNVQKELLKADEVSMLEFVGGFKSQYISNLKFKINQLSSIVESNNKISIKLSKEYEKFQNEISKLDFEY